MSALTETSAATPKQPPVMSRYRGLRGKSVSETKKAADRILADENNIMPLDQTGSGGPFRMASQYRNRAKTLTSTGGEGQAPAPSHPPMPRLPLSPSLKTSSSPAAPASQKEQNSPSTKLNGSSKPSASASKPDRPVANGIERSESLGDLQNQFPAVPMATAITADTAVDSGVINHARQKRAQARAALARHEGGQGGGVEKNPQTHNHDLFLEAEQQQRRAEEEAEEAARLEAETDRILAEQKKKDLERLQTQLMTHTAAANQHRPSPLQLKPRSPVLEKFSFLTRARRSKAATLSPTSSTCASLDFNSGATSLEPNLSPRAFIEPGRRGIVPQTDVPLSASNAGDRQVQVRCRGATINVNVTLETNVVDVLFACADSMPRAQPINTETSVVVESYAHLGLARRLRRYERMRDVLNSWGRNTQNTLLVDPCTDALDGRHRDLDLSSVGRSEAAPPGFILQLHYSQRPGKWSKRFVTLLESGQMLASKKADALVGADGSGSAAAASLSSFWGAATSLCHLSDFDIYTPTESRAKKHLKPPKRYCYAIKSQQKTTVFAADASDNFVHFFATEDPDVAHKFHSLVHAWRSWYLVNRRSGHEGGGGQQQQHQRHQQRNSGGSTSTARTAVSEAAPQILPVRHQPQKSVSHVKVEGGRHRLRVSVDGAPYAIGAFAPLLDLGRFDKPINEFGKDWVPEGSSRASTLPPSPPLGGGGASDDAAVGEGRAAAAAVAVGQSQTPPRHEQGPQQQQLLTPTTAAGEGEFAENGLLGAGYDERRRAAGQRGSGSGSSNTLPTIPGGADGPFTEGPSLLNGGAPGSPAASVAAGPSSSSAASVRPPPKTEAKSWFPSAADHSARQRARSISEAQARGAAARPSTSAGEKSSSSRQQQQYYNGHNGGAQPHQQRNPRRPPLPAPLVNLTPRFVEAPQWARPQGGGIRAPPGVPLVDLAGSAGFPSPSSPRFLEVPPRSLIRRPDPNPPPPAGQAQAQARHHHQHHQLHQQRPSTSDGAGSARSVRPRSNTVGNGNGGGGGLGRRPDFDPLVPPPQALPPVPPLPGVMARDGRPPGVEQWARGVAAERERVERSGRGRSGTVKY